ncbi:MAG: hypothetical protein QM504_10080 [Pseudomonadota bacterium]
MLNSYFLIYLFIAYLGCFAYSYRINSITGFIFFLSASLVLILTRYYEGEELSKLLKNIILSLYILCVVFGPVFLYHAINMGSMNPKSSTGYVTIMLISFSILILTIINLIKFKTYGKDYFIDANNESLKSEVVREREENKEHLDDVVKKYKNN